jgi:hypothetical protein
MVATAFNQVTPRSLADERAGMHFNRGRVTLVLFRTRRRDRCSRLKEGERRRVRKRPQKEAAGAADAGLMQIERSEGGV